MVDETGTVRIGLDDYSVMVGAGLLDKIGELCVGAAPAHRYAIISDANVAPRWLARAEQSFRHSGMEPIAAVVPAGEASKTRENWASLTDWMLGAGAGRDTTVVALGGGVVGDLAGFVAATYMRGVPVVQVPTSLLAMVDASIGGKTGVDTTSGKNLVGAFHQPALVIVDTATLGTLPRAHRRAGAAEVLKHGAISDAGYFLDASGWAAAMDAAGDAASHGEHTVQIVAESVRIKASVVKSDPLERGRRQVLNAGHTVAHAIEHVSGYALLHGEAVAIGLVVEAGIGEAAGVTAPGTSESLRQALGACGLPTRIPAGLDASAIVGAMQLDKKARGGGVRFSLLKSIGSAWGSDATGWSVPVDERVVRDALVTHTQGA